MADRIYGFTFTGWKALIALGIFGGWYGLRAYAHMQPVNDDERRAVETFLTMEYSGNSPEDLLRRLKAVNAGQPDERNPAPPPQVNLRSVTARGNYTHVIVRVEIAVNGGAPPDHHPVRFLSLSHQAGKWVVLWNSDSYEYFRAMWSPL